MEDLNPTLLRLSVHLCDSASSLSWFFSTLLGIPLDENMTPYPEREVTPAELEAVAKHYLPEDVYLHLTVMPSDSTSYARGDSTTTQ